MALLATIGFAAIRLAARFLEDGRRAVHDRLALRFRHALVDLLALAGSLLLHSHRGTRRAVGARGFAMLAQRALDHDRSTIDDDLALDDDRPLHDYLPLDDQRPLHVHGMVHDHDAAQRPGLPHDRAVRRPPPRTVHDVRVVVAHVDDLRRSRRDDDRPGLLVDLLLVVVLEIAARLRAAAKLLHGVHHV